MTRILIIEDEASISKLVMAYLEAEHFEVFVAEDGRMGLGMFRRHQPQLVILDIMLLEIDGYELLQLMRRESDVYVLMLTVDAIGQDAVDVLIGGDTEELEAVSARSSEVYTALLNGNYDMVYEAMGGFVSAEQIEAQETAMRQDLEGLLGTLGSFDVLGTAPNQIGNPTTTLRLNFENGAAYVRWSWGDNVLAGIDVLLEPVGGTTVQAFPTDETTFATYNLLAHSSTIFSFEGSDLIITLEDRQVTATKTE